MDVTSSIKHDQLTNLMCASAAHALVLDIKCRASCQYVKIKSQRKLQNQPYKFMFSLLAIQTSANTTTGTFQFIFWGASCVLSLHVEGAAPPRGAQLRSLQHQD